MILSERVQRGHESVTLELNAKAIELEKGGAQIYNLTAGQLPFKPSQKLVEEISRQLESLSSFQYSPVMGLPELREKVMKFIGESRGMKWDGHEFDCVVSTGAKQSLFNLIGALVNPGDEVMILVPYWVSYPEIIRYWEGRPVRVMSSSHPGEGPSMESLERAITPKTKAIILNTPSNPMGVYYRKEWVKELAEFMMNYPQVAIISDEIYSQLYYKGPGPQYPYHFYPELLERTFIVDGISKSMACTGLRIGFTLGRKEVMKAMGKVQGQSTSGANALIQKALVEYDFSDIQHYLAPIKSHLLANADVVKEKLDDYGLSQAWYQINGAFYFFISFEGLPVLKKFQGPSSDRADYAGEICQELITQTGIVMVPSTDFGRPNGGRISLVLEKRTFQEAWDRACQFISQL